MQDWRALAKTNRYQANGFSDDLDCGIAQYSGPVLSLSLADDPFAPPASVDAVVDKFIAASVSNVLSMNRHWVIARIIFAGCVPRRRQ